jgi:hypothetical protein
MEKALLQWRERYNLPVYVGVNGIRGEPMDSMPADYHWA